MPKLSKTTKILLGILAVAYITRYFLFGDLESPNNKGASLIDIVKFVREARIDEKPSDWCADLVTGEEVGEALGSNSINLNITGSATESASTLDCDLVINSVNDKIDINISICDDTAEVCDKIIGTDPVKISITGNLVSEKEKDLRNLLTRKLEPILEN